MYTPNCPVDLIANRYQIAAKNERFYQRQIGGWHIWAIGIFSNASIAQVHTLITLIQFFEIYLFTLFWLQKK